MRNEQFPRKTIILIVTDNCNLNCSYCFEKNKKHQSMTFKIAKQIIDKEFSLDDGHSEIEIDFFGGEPFLEFDLIKKIHDYIKHMYSDKKWVCFATTNGTILTDGMKQWLYDNKNTFCAGLSLDGTKEMHDLSRDNSFDLIDIDFFQTNWPFQGVKMTISPETLPKLAEGILFIQSLGIPCAGSFAYGIDWNIEKNIPVLEEQLEILAKWYIQNFTVPIAEILSKNIANMEKPMDEAQQWCGTGTHMKAYDVNGNVSPCQMFSELSWSADFIPNKDIFSQSELIKDGCKNCPVYSVCPTCYGLNYQLTGSIAKRDRQHCEINKRIILFNAKVQLNRLLSKAKSTKLTYEEFATLESINWLYDHLSELEIVTP